MTQNPGYTRHRRLKDGETWQKIATHPYEDPSGQLAFVVHREKAVDERGRPIIGKNGKQIKRCWQYWSTDDGKKPPGAPTYVYRQPEVQRSIRAGKTILLTEGENKVDRLKELGLIATCNEGGAENWKPEHAYWLRGADVVILPDNDQDGQDSADVVGRTLDKVASRRRLLELPNLPEHGDVVDWLENGGAKDQLLDLVARAREWTPYEPAKKSRDGWHLSLVCLADVEPKEIVWLWPGRIARGKVTIVAGNPGIAKSTMLFDVVARVTRGGQWPGGGAAPKGSAIIVTSEDDAADTIHPRISAAGGDVSKVRILTAMKKGDERRGFDLMVDVADLEDAIRDMGDVVLVIFDPITAYMGRPGKVDTHRNTDVRAVLEPLQYTAAQTSVAIVGINHLTKNGSGEALMRVLGSVGMVAVSRATYLVVKDEVDPMRRLLLPAKNNIGDSQTGFAFKVVQKPTGYDKPAYAVAVEWENEPVNRTADEALAAARESGSAAARGDAKTLLRAMLADGPLPHTEIIEAAETEGISEMTLRRAKKDLGILSEKGPSGWSWRFPDPKPETDPPF